MIIKIPHNRPTLGSEETDASLNIIKSGKIADGEEVRKFEEDFCNYMGIEKNHAIAVSSGTVALFLALWALNGKNKKIAIPAYVCSSLHHAVKLIEGKEVFIDVQKDTPNIDLQKVNEVLPDIAIIPHMFGIPIKCELNESTKIIEDCCQSLGAEIKGVKVGLQGEIGIFSFFATKLITSGGQGGMIISKNDKIIQKIRKYLDYDVKIDSGPKFNFVMSDLQAAIGRVQLKKLPELLQRREKIFEKYKNAGLDLVESNNEGIKPVRYRAILRCKNPSKIIQELENEGITSIVPMEGWFEEIKFPNSFKLTKKYVSLPIFPSLTDDEVEKIISVIKNTREI